MSSTSRPPLPVGVLISGTGRTLQNMIRLVAAGQLNLDIRVVVSSAAGAKGLEFAAAAGIAGSVLQRSDFPTTEAYSQAVFHCLRAAGARLVVLAGFLKQLYIPDDFAGRVINIHPALIPAFCGKGFYGHHVHEAAIAYGVKLSGCTVHFVDNHYDNGPVILQEAVPVLDDDTPDTLAARVFEAESRVYPEAMRLIESGRVQVEGRRVRILPA